MSDYQNNTPNNGNPNPNPNPNPAPNQGQQPYNAVPNYGAPQQPQQNYQPGYQQPYPPTYQQPMRYDTPPQGYQQKSRLAAALLAFLFGVFGVHNFYLGFNTKAIIQLIVSLAGGVLTCGLATVAVAIWGFVDGIQLLVSSPAHRYDGNNVILRD